MTLCFAGDTITTILASNHGFQYIDEGNLEHSKKGYVALTVGAELSFTVNTLRDGSNDSMVLVILGYLASYEHMGVASVR